MGIPSPTQFPRTGVSRVRVCRGQTIFQRRNRRGEDQHVKFGETYVARKEKKEKEEACLIYAYVSSGKKRSDEAQTRQAYKYCIFLAP